MIFSFNTVNNQPVVFIDQFYTKEEYAKIWQELCFLNNDPDNFLDPENTGSAWDPDENGNPIYKKQNKALSLDSVYADRRVSSILKANRKIFSPEVIDELIKFNCVYKYLLISDYDGTLISYYENADYYLPHRDIANITALTWFYQEPKSFTGGNLTVEGTLEIECIKNRCVIFPSILDHEVSKIQLDEVNKNKNLGRYCMSQFISFKNI